MAYDLVTDQELEGQYKKFQDMGIPEPELVPTLDRFAADLNASRAAANTSIGYQALAFSANRLISSSAIGLNEVLGGGKGVLTDAADTVKDWVNPFYEEHVAKAQAGQWWTRPDGWAATIGGAIPQIAEFAALSFIPTPGTKIAAVGRVAKFAESLMANAPMMGVVALQSTGDLKEAMVNNGVEEKTASLYAKLGGMGMAMFLEPAIALKLPGVKGIEEALARNFAGQVKAGGAVRLVAKELGIATGGGGLGMMTAAEISNAAFTQAFKDMRQIDPEWKPTNGYTPQSLTDAFIGGSILVGAARTGTRLPFVVAKFGSSYEKAKQLLGLERPTELKMDDPLRVDVKGVMVPAESMKNLQDFAALPESSKKNILATMEPSDMINLANVMKTDLEPKRAGFENEMSAKYYVQEKMGVYDEGPVLQAAKPLSGEKPLSVQIIKKSQEPKPLLKVPDRSAQLINQFEKLTDPLKRKYLNEASNKDMIELANAIRDHVEDDRIKMKPFDSETGRNERVAERYVREKLGFNEVLNTSATRFETVKSSGVINKIANKEIILADAKKSGLYESNKAMIKDDIMEGRLSREQAIQLHDNAYPDIRDWTEVKNGYRVNVNPAIIDRVPSSQRQYGANINQAVNLVLGDPRFKGSEVGPDKQIWAQLKLKRDSLLKTGLDSRIVDDLMSRKEGTDFTDVSLSLANKLTREQYGRYLNEVHGTLFREILRPEAANKAVNRWDATVLADLGATTFTDVKTGRQLPLIPLQTTDLPKGAHIFGPFAGTFPYFRSLSDALKKNFMPMVEVLRVRGRQANDALHTISQYMIESKFALPKWMREGNQQQVLKQIEFFLNTDDVGKMSVLKHNLSVEDLQNAKVLAEEKQIALTGPITYETIALMTKAYETGKVSPEKQNYSKDIMTYAKLADDRKNVYALFEQKSGVPFHKLINDYQPRVWKMMESGKTMGQIHADEMKRIEAIKDEGRRVTEEQHFQAFYDMINTRESLNRKYQRAGDEKLFQEYDRMGDEEAHQFLSKAALETDPDVLMHMYVQGAVKKFYFEDIAPMMRMFSRDVLRELETTPLEKGGRAQGKVVYDQLMGLYNEYLGFSPADMAVASKLQIGSSPGIFSNAIDSAFKYMDQVYGHKTDVFSKKWTHNQMFNNFMKTAMITSVGFPFNATMWLENIPQQLIAASIFGFKNLIQGIRKAKDPETQAWVKKMGIIVDEHPYGSNPKMTGDFLGDVAAKTLIPMDGADGYCRRTTASMAKHILEEVQTQTDTLGRKLTKKEMGAILFATTKLDARLDNAFNKMWKDDHMKNLEKMGFNKEEIARYREDGPRGFSSILDATHDLYVRGEWDLAQRFYGQAVVDGSNFVYSQGGGVRVARTSVTGQYLATFLRFPSNWMTYNTWIHNPKNGAYTAVLRYWTANLLLGAGLAAVGVNATQFLGAGPVMQKFGPVGPFARFLNKLMALASAQAKSAQAQITSPEEDRKRYESSKAKAKQALDPTPYSLR